MKSTKNCDNVKNLYDSLYNALKNDDKNGVEECLESIDFAEEEFLHGYKRKKKEGVYFILVSLLLLVSLCNFQILSHELIFAHQSLMLKSESHHPEPKMV